MADVNLSTTETLKVGLTDTPSALAKATSTTLVEYLIAGETIFPSGYDLAAVPGDGITMRERTLSDNWLGLQSVNNFTSSGMVVPASSLSLSLTMPSGVAYIAGRYLAIPATVLTFGPSTTSYVFLKVTRDANLNVTGAWYEVNTTSTPPTDATPIATVTSLVGSISATTDERLLGPGGCIVITSGVAWIVKAGLNRVYVELIGASGGGGGGLEAAPGSTNGSAGGSGGTTTFSTISASGGAGGGGGQSSTQPDGLAGVGSGGAYIKRGGGQAGGPGGSGSAQGVGGTGGDGGYAAGYFTVTPGASITIAIGAAGSAGAGGAGGGAGADGNPGTAGTAGIIVVHY